MRVTYQAAGYAPHKVRDRFVRFDPSARQYLFCERGVNPRWDIRQGEVDESELPAAVALEARTAAGFFPPYVVWPLA